MKKICLLICCVLILQMLCACTGNDEDLQFPVNFYYCNKEISYNSPEGIIRAEKREGVNFNGNPTALLHDYLSGPSSSDLQSLIPSDVYLVSCEMDADTACVVLSTQFSKLSGVKLTTACGAILMTLQEYAGVQSIRISAKDAQLDDKDEIMLTMEDIVLMDAVSNQE